MDITPVFDIAEICYQLGVEDVIISPGSRNAPLTIAFARHPHLNSYSISDERSAGFIGLGMSKKSNRPVVVLCTSGSAGLNYAPAVAEAFFSKIPLIVITADRPPEWLDQLDGQTIRQNKMFDPNIKGSFQTPVDLDTEDAIWYHQRIISDAMNLALDGPQGPVHINVPFREPFYPEKELTFTSSMPKLIRKLRHANVLLNNDWVNLVSDWKRYTKKLIIVGQQAYDANLIDTLQVFSQEKHVPIIGDIISNAHYLNGLINMHDLFLGQLNEEALEALQPDLIITTGGSVISKNLKLFLRRFKPKSHWHLQKDGQVADTFQSLTKVIPMGSASFFKSIQDIAPKASVDYQNSWTTYQKSARKFSTDFHAEAEFNEFSTVNTILDNLPIGCDIHLANSMPVRWANFYGMDYTHPQIEIYANRGTSGIDGCSSTAVGSAIASDKTTLLITGDMAFFYDQNAFWNNYVPDNLRVIVLNNHGGGIFDIIPGPSDQKEHEEFFLTNQPLQAESVAKTHGLEYYHCQSLQGLSDGLDKFWVRNGKAKILEIETDIKNNTNTFNTFKKEAKEIWN